MVGVGIAIYWTTTVIHSNLVVDSFIFVCKHLHRCLPFVIIEWNQWFQTKTFQRDGWQIHLSLFFGVRPYNNFLTTPATIMLSPVIEANDNDSECCYYKKNDQKNYCHGLNILVICFLLKYFFFDSFNLCSTSFSFYDWKIFSSLIWWVEWGDHKEWRVKALIWGFRSDKYLGWVLDAQFFALNQIIFSACDTWSQTFSSRSNVDLNTFCENRSFQDHLIVINCFYWPFYFIGTDLSKNEVFVPQVRHSNIYNRIVITLNRLNGSAWTTYIGVVWACEVMTLQIDILSYVKRANSSCSLTTSLILTITTNPIFEVFRNTKEQTLIDAISSTCSTTGCVHGDSCTYCILISGEEGCEQLRSCSYT